MDALEIAAVDQLAEELRTLHWEKFVDASDIRRDSETNRQLFEEEKAAWERIHPISHYVAEAMFQLGFSSS